VFGWALPAAGAAFEPDEQITSLVVRVHTADILWAGTDDTVSVELMDWPIASHPPGLWSTSIDSDADDFERGSTRDYALPSWYYTGRIVNDIDRVCVRKSSDGLAGGWAFGWITVMVNGKELYTNRNVSDPDQHIWLEDDSRTWCSGDFARVLFVAPVIETLGLPDAGSDQNYRVRLTAVGGRKPLTWSITGSGAAFTSDPTLEPVSGVADGLAVNFTAHTITTSSAAQWSGSITVHDADGRSSIRAFTMHLVFSLPPPVITRFTPTFGWPGLSPAEPTPVRVVIDGQNFDSRTANATSVYFSGDGGTWVAAHLLEATGTQLRVDVPTAAVPGHLRVQTAFGQTDSGSNFTAHPAGYRFTGGFSFGNVPSTFADEYAYERYEQTFGVCEMWDCVLGVPVIPNPSAMIYYLATRGIIDNGVCHGMSLTSLQMREGYLTTTGFGNQGLDYPLEGSLWDLTGPSAPSAALSNFVQSRQLAMMSDEALAYYLHQIDVVPNVAGTSCRMDARTALTNLTTALGHGLDDPVMLAFAKACSLFEGHVVVPYNIESDGDLRRIRVWDSNRPARTNSASDQNSAFTVDPADGDWSYPWSSTETWRGIYMFTIPFSVYGHQEDWSLPGGGTVLSGLDLLLGFAAAGGGTRMAQVSDSSGARLYLADGSLDPDRSHWPDGIRPVPLLAPGASKPRMVAFTKTTPATFQLSPAKSAIGTQSGLLSFIRGRDFSLSVEDLQSAANVSLDPGTNTLSIAPLERQTTAILRLTRRLSDGLGHLDYAIRAHDLVAGQTVSIAPGRDPDTVAVRTGSKPLTLDLEVAHTGLQGEQHVLENDGVELPAKATATFGVSSYPDLGTAGTRPIAVSLLTTPDQPVKRSVLGAKVASPVVVAPSRILAPLKQSLTLDLSASLPVVKGQALTFENLYGPALRVHDSQKLSLGGVSGSQVLRLVAMDELGRRSFPRSVLVSPAGTKAISPYTCSGTDTIIPPRASKAVPIGLNVGDLSVNKVVLDLSLRQRLCGMGVARPIFTGDQPKLSAALQALRPAVKQNTVREGETLHLEISWSSETPLTGRFDLCGIPIGVPARTSLGSTFLLRGSGVVDEAVPLRAGPTHDLNVLPTEVRVWGGPEPSSLGISGLSVIGEGTPSAFETAAPGLPAGADNVGWWVEGLGGRATITPDSADPTHATVEGARAGLIRLHLVAGTQTAEKDVFVKAKGGELQLKSPRLAVTQRAPIVTRFPLPIAAVRGDLSGDDRFDISDVVSALRGAVGIGTLTESQRKAGDLNGDGKLNIADVVLMLRELVGVSTKPVEIG
jgi:hypothetical protein